MVIDAGGAKMKEIWSLLYVLKEYKPIRVELGSRSQCCAKPVQKCTYLLEVWYYYDMFESTITEQWLEIFKFYNLKSLVRSNELVTDVVDVPTQPNPLILLLRYF